MTAVWVVSGALAYLVVSFAVACWVGRRLRRQQPHNHPEGGNR